MYDTLPDELFIGPHPICRQCGKAYSGGTRELGKPPGAWRHEPKNCSCGENDGIISTGRGVMEHDMGGEGLGRCRGVHKAGAAQTSRRGYYAVVARG